MTTFLTIVRRQWLGVVCTTAFVLVSVIIWLGITTPRYTAEMIVGPSPASSQADMIQGMSGSGLGALSGLSALSNLGLQSDEQVSAYTEFFTTVTLTKLAEKLETEHKVSHIVFSKSWNEGTKSWHYHGLLSRIEAGLEGLFGIPHSPSPSAQDIANYIAKHVDISPIDTTSMRELAFSFKDPKFAQDFLTWIHQDADQMVRTAAEKQATQQIAYLNDRLEKVTSNTDRMVLAQLLSQEEQFLMLAQTDLPYAARVVQPPTVEQFPSHPNPGLSLVLALVGGLFLGVFVAFATEAWKSRELPAATQGVGDRA